MNAPLLKPLSFLFSLYLHIDVVEMLDRNKNVFMNVQDFKAIKRSESLLKMNQAYSFMNANENNRTSYLGDGVAFFEEIDAAWELAYLAENFYFAEEDKKTTFNTAPIGVASPFFPFLVCVSTSSNIKSSTKSGFNRLKLLAERFGTVISENISNTTIYTDSEYLAAAERWSDFGLQNHNTAGTNSAVYPMYNTDDSSCFAFRSLASEAEKTATYSYGEGAQTIKESTNTMYGEEFLVIPFTDSMKLEQGVIEDIEQIFMEIIKSKQRRPNIFGASVNPLSEKSHMIKLSIQLSPGTGDGTVETSNIIAKNVTDTARKLASKYYSEENAFKGGSRHLRRKYKETTNSVTENRKHLKHSSLLTRLLERNNIAGHDYLDNYLPRRILMDEDGHSSMKGICDDALMSIDYASYFFGNAFDVSVDITAGEKNEIQEKDTYKCALLFVKALTNQPEILSVATIPTFQLFNDNLNQIVQNGTQIIPKPFHEMGYTGKGQVVAVSDAGLNLDSCYFKSKLTLPKNGNIKRNRRKVIQYIVAGGDDKPSGSHGSHVTGTIAGKRSYDGIKASANEEGNGVAPDAKISFMDIGKGDELNPPSNVKILFEPPKQAGAFIFSASWGDLRKLGSYSYYSNRFDEYLYINQNLFITFAAGNFGEKGIAYPATAKNVVCVGATNNVLDSKELAYFSSRGEVEGNRIKPDILAPGNPVYSASGTSSCGLVKISGTSMAAPAVSGSVAIIRQYLQEHNMAMPSGSLLRSILLNGGKRIGTGSPYDNNQGFGLMNLMSSLPLPGHNKISLLCQNLKILEEGSINKVEIKIQKGNESSCDTTLSVTMVYADPPGASIMNDLDLEVERSNRNGRIFYPNPTAGTKGSRDKKNNVERIRIRNIEQEHEDTFIIRIIGRNMIQPKIKYSLALTGCFLVSENIISQNDTMFIPYVEI